MAVSMQPFHTVRSLETIYHFYNHKAPHSKLQEKHSKVSCLGLSEKPVFQIFGYIQISDLCTAVLEENIGWFYIAVYNTKFM